MKYVDGFVIPLPKKNIPMYRKIARAAGKVWMEHGALEFRECVAEDTTIQGVISFPAHIKAKAGETVLFSWIVYKSRAHRDKVNAKVMADPRMNKMMENKEMPFDVKRMVMGGFETIVDLS